MELNKISGDLIFKELIISPKISLEQLNNLKEHFDILNGVQNAPFISFHIRSFEEDKYALSLIFSDGELMNLNIGCGRKFDFPPFTITEKEIQIIDQWLSLLGGENSYIWGSVEKSIDRKGGSISILIKYAI
ncbi:MAG: hypothetical protein NT150_01600 [Bacteroidetes bacterium]|nr:hypothetical protein [Bacteroidota bacterium]